MLIWLELEELLKTPNIVRHISPEWFNYPTMKHEDLNFVGQATIERLRTSLRVDCGCHFSWRHVNVS